MMSFTIREAIYLLKLFEGTRKQTVFHCAAGFGRTGCNILLLLLADYICGYVQQWQKTGEEDDKQTAITFVKDYICQDNFDNIKSLFTAIYNDVNSRVIEEIFDFDKKKNFIPGLLYPLFYQRMNTIKIAILFYITKKGYYIDDFSKCEFYLDYYDAQSDNSKKVYFFSYNLDNFLGNRQLKYVKDHLFRNEESETVCLKGLEILDGTNFPATLDNIGPDYPHNPVPLATVVSGGGKSKLLYKNLQRISKRKSNGNRTKKNTRIEKEVM